MREIIRIDPNNYRFYGNKAYRTQMYKLRSNCFGCRTVIQRVWSKARTLANSRIAEAVHASAEYVSPDTGLIFVRRGMPHNWGVHDGGSESQDGGSGSQGD